MLERLKEDGICLYQDEVVDFLLLNCCSELLRENADGNIAITTTCLSAFRTLTPDNVVWVKRERYWRFRTPEDELGREARG